jgi:hypothetical protein
MSELLEDLVNIHKEGECSCDLTEGGYGLCIAGQFIEGVISEEDFLSEAT